MRHARAPQPIPSLEAPRTLKRIETDHIEALIKMATTAPRLEAPRTLKRIETALALFVLLLSDGGSGSTANLKAD